MKPIEYLANYLPYELHIKNNVGKVVELTPETMPYHIEKGCKPLLNPIRSEAFKEAMNQLLGEGFVYEWDVDSPVATWEERSHKFLERIEIKDYRKRPLKTFRFYQVMSEYHVDIFDLISQGKAIDKTTLK